MLKQLIIRVNIWKLFQIFLTIIVITLIITFLHLNFTYRFNSKQLSQTSGKCDNSTATEMLRHKTKLTFSPSDKIFFVQLKNASIVPKKSNISGIHQTKISTTPDPKARCKEMRRRVREGLIDYARNEGDEELNKLLRPLFTKKKLVVWSLDHHIGPISDLRNLFEPLGVEFIEHTLYHNCELMCTCDQLENTPLFNQKNILHIQSQMIKEFYNRYNNERDIVRTDAFVVTYSIPLVELYELLNRSIIVLDALRYEVTLRHDTNRWNALNERIRNLVLADVHRGRHIIGANSRYDVEYMHYFTGIKPEYIPNFCAYTGEHYNPSRHSFLYARRPLRQVGDYWYKPFENHYKKINATFQILELTKAYKNFDFSTIASHLGVVYLPYQTSLMMFFEQYRMDIPLFAPSLEFLVKLHMEHYLVYDKSLRNWNRFDRSLIAPHPTYNVTHTWIEHYNLTQNVSIDEISSPVPTNSHSSKLPRSISNATARDNSTPTLIQFRAKMRAITRALTRKRSRVLDPNNEVDPVSVSYWFSLSDFYTFPHIVTFNSTEQLVEILQDITLDSLRDISKQMHRWNIQELKNLLRYWRRRLSDIARLSTHRPE